MTIKTRSLNYFGSHQPALSPSPMSRRGGCRCVYTQTENKNKSRSQTPAAKDANRINSVLSAPVHVQKTLMFPSPREGGRAAPDEYILKLHPRGRRCNQVTASSVPSNLFSSECSTPMSALSSSNCSLLCSKFGSELLLAELPSCAVFLSLLALSLSFSVVKGEP